MDNTRVYKMSFANAYPNYIAKSEKKERFKKGSLSNIENKTSFEGLHL